MAECSCVYEGNIAGFASSGNRVCEESYRVCLWNIIRAVAGRVRAVSHLRHWHGSVSDCWSYYSTSEATFNCIETESHKCQT